MVCPRPRRETGSITLFGLVGCMDLPCHMDLRGGFFLGMRPPLLMAWFWTQGWGLVYTMWQREAFVWAFQSQCRVAHGIVLCSWHSSNRVFLSVNGMLYSYRRVSSSGGGSSVVPLHGRRAFLRAAAEPTSPLWLISRRKSLTVSTEVWTRTLKTAVGASAILLKPLDW